MIAEHAFNATSPVQRHFADITDVSITHSLLFWARLCSIPLTSIGSIFWAQPKHHASYPTPRGFG